MIDDRRLASALLAGLLPLLMLAAAALVTPSTGLALAGDTSSPGARLALDELRIDELELSAVTVEGTETARFDIGAIERSARLVIERDVNVSSVVPGAGAYTLRLSAPTAELEGLDLYTARACVSGVGLTNLGLLEGLVDPFLNSAVAEGYDDNLLTGLLNLIGPSGLINFTVEEFRAETVALDTTTISATGLETSFGPRTVDPAFAGSCIQ